MRFFKQFGLHFLCKYVYFSSVEQENRFAMLHELAAELIQENYHGKDVISRRLSVFLFEFLKVIHNICLVGLSMRHLKILQ